MSIKVLMLHAPEIDPSLATYVLENSDLIQAVDCVSGAAGLREAELAFKSGYDVVVTDLVLDYGATFRPMRENPDMAKPKERNYRGKVELEGLSLIKRSMEQSYASDQPASFVTLTAWDNINNIIETYRLGGKSFLTLRHPSRGSSLVDAVVAAADGNVTFPFDDLRTKNMALAITKPSFHGFTVTELETVCLLVNRLSTSQIAKLINSKSIKGTEGRIGRVVKKLGLADRVAVVEYALDIGLEPDTVIQVS